MSTALAAAVIDISLRVVIRCQVVPGLGTAAEEVHWVIGKHGAGAVVIVSLFYLLVPDPPAPGDERFLTPPAKALVTVARALKDGLDGFSQGNALPCWAVSPPA